MKRSPMKPGKGFKPRATPIARVGVLAQSSFQRVAPKRKAKRPKSTAAERAHLGVVAAMGCCLCQHLGMGATPAEVHHVRARHGWGRSGHFATIPLCPTHHRGQPGGVHDMGREEFAAYYGISELELLDGVMRHFTNSEAATGLQPDAASITKHL
jgi:hypothetical protein